MRSDDGVGGVGQALGCGIMEEGGRPGPRVWHHGGGGGGQALGCDITEEGG